jgi:hypothetical protein
VHEGQGLQPGQRNQAKYAHRWKFSCHLFYGEFVRICSYPVGGNLCPPRQGVKHKGCLSMTLVPLSILKGDLKSFDDSNVLGSQGTFTHINEEEDYNYCKLKSLVWTATLGSGSYTAHTEMIGSDFEILKD